MCIENISQLRTMFTLISAVILFNCFCECLLQNSSSVTSSDLQCLNELPLHQLLKIKKSLQTMSDMVDRSGISNYSDRIGKGNAIDLSSGYLFDTAVNDSINALPLMGDQLKYVWNVGFDRVCE